MMIKCRLCGLEIRSHNLLPDSSESHVMEAMTLHLGKSHPLAAEELAITVTMAPQMIAAYLLISRYVDIPENETMLLNSFHENEQVLLEMFNQVPK